MRTLLKEIIKRYLLAPFSNKVTRVLLYVGSSLLALPTLEYLAFDLVLDYVFEQGIKLDYPTEETLVAGFFVLLLAVIHNIFVEKNKTIAELRQLEIGEVKIRGNLSSDELNEIIKHAPASNVKEIDYEYLSEKYQPKLIEAVFNIDQGNVEEGRKLLASVMNELPIGIVGTTYLNYGYYLSAAGSKNAEGYYLVAKQIFEDIDYKKGLAKVYQNLGESARLNHRFVASEEFHRKSIELRKKLDDDVALADSISSLGLTFAQQCRHEEAEALFNESIEIFEKERANSQVCRVKSYIDALRSCPKY